MKIAVIGLGYVGCVSAAAFAKLGHNVIGVDVIKEKVDAINNGKAGIYEKGLNDLIKEQVEKGNLRATMDYKQILDTDISFICVGTPSKSDGDLDMTYLEETCRKLGEVFWDGENSSHIVVIRSTMFPGSLAMLKKILWSESIAKLSRVAVNPEFLREGSAIKDFFTSSYIVVGADDKEIGAKVMSCYDRVYVEKFIVEPGVAQMIKYASNSWHGAKVAFANEIGSICNKFNVDAQKLMHLFCADKTLNISPYYLRPGFAYGGSCLSKDLSTIVCRSKKEGIKIPLLNSIKDSNEEHIQRAINLIKSKNIKKIGILGFSFKSGTDDTRNTPIKVVIDDLNKGDYDIKVFDNVNKSDSINKVLKQDLLIIANNDIRYKELAEKSGKDIINLQEGY